ncbi:GNAT family N-acetyltransferase [Mycolicibacterium brumae]|uniref:GNAT family N-acetyltransferase n=1 Tax=Mycolicibacterium brumae TaxID=85968 RepID=A0A2G5PFK9_9MYCO|nr:GNAT family N-acetyltransferase [Mycolicibacterium brumae]MCV7191968.1 GNAT family N-acetyltransferase [Mycolicibacterium brumae]PIB76823.1 GNAT family N-acetyltransferase [Mycolicibacterium brumae]RWA20639.1 hypothetical protein MBRU_02985 [Mycolicibacterium brumae DSM 44177]UWW07735.1 acetyltransferase [Mycolicibacterium brumae]
MRVRLRPAELGDVALLEKWDRAPHVIACATDNPDATTAFEDTDWAEEITAASSVSYYLIAEVDARPIGAMQVIDPQAEPTHYWGDVAPNLRALDIWIGEPDMLARGYGTEMMTQAIDDAFADPAVEAIIIDPLASNTDAHRFYARLGFRPVGRRMFGDDDCLVHRLNRITWLNSSVQMAAPPRRPRIV